VHDKKAPGLYRYRRRSEAKGSWVLEIVGLDMEIRKKVEALRDIWE